MNNRGKRIRAAIGMGWMPRGAAEPLAIDLAVLFGDALVEE
jgi:hypothetical protein